MCKSIICIFLILLVSNLERAKGSSFSKTENFIRKLKESASFSKNFKASCQKSSDCLDGFFCKNNDCIAKRSEGNFCLSGNNDECMCGKCTLDEMTWNKICLSDSFDGECLNGGITKFNSCNSNKDCPKGHFCDAVDGKICVSKLTPGRLCFDDSMCICGKCEEVSEISRPNMPPITYNICSSC